MSVTGFRIDISNQSFLFCQSNKIHTSFKKGKETTNEQNFVEEFIAHHFPEKQKDVDFVVIGIGGKDKLDISRLPFEENTLAGGTNILLFDAYFISAESCENTLIK